MLANMLASAARPRALLCRLYSSALNGNRSPMDIVTNKSNPMMHQEDSTSTSTEDAFELRVPGRGLGQTWVPLPS